MHCPLYIHFFEKKIRCIHLRCSQHTMNKNTVLTCKAGLENCSAGLRQANNTDMFCTFEWYACMFFFFFEEHTHVSILSDIFSLLLGHCYNFKGFLYKQRTSLPITCD